MALTAKQQDELRELLERERRKLVRRLRRFSEDLADMADAGLSQHMADTAAASTERETAFMMAGEEGERLLEVDRALARLAQAPEAFDSCRTCGGEIAHERLEALPYTQLCIECKRTEESGVS